MELAEELEGVSLLQDLCAISKALIPDLEACSAASSNLAESMACTSKELDVEAVELDITSESNFSLASPAYEKFVEPMTRTMARLSLNWSDLKQDVAHSCLEERFLLGHKHPSPVSLPFLLDLHTEV